ncbi:MAG: DNA repair protein RadA [Stygiobacter sp. RIFOXYC12_FULL_38_8]|nr:MAG: DNA repair protein RadA [Stygiobacter sp. GWC2_38_9]OGV11035.1 MAG: DNA repair protein RadA [Stygiobacter sp. RIFOXYA2_FULL_38_8]OGV12387.1 MAG: DNA repair protein RadA [Stygiobacter sp. RIFOXYC2_FULL_38_25]OGV25256.1 MAG: DNA repair protein RadA [Stygiobacter sp. RIFOXYC12_FULL_38_8]OGV83061.1 MAG: DNA repair protein RadA [Stygiobacter sp. GWF2_38_21]
MARNRIKYVCSSCGYESLKWIGRCPSCESWNTFTEELIEEKKTGKKSHAGDEQISKLSDHVVETEERVKTNIAEFDRVLGGGLMPGSVVLIGGDPGIGKSTLVMQAASKVDGDVLYVTGEESANQISLRAKRLKVTGDKISIMTETDLDVILGGIKKLEPKVVIVDSIQTTYKPDFDNAPGTVTQIRECTVELMQLAKKTHCAIMIVGHVTKEGMIAGPKILEHVVDTVLQFEGERSYSYRVLRAQKNRFGSTNEIGIFEMHDDGLHEVLNPSEIFLSERDKQTTGSVVTASIEGTRPILLEVQALVTPSSYGNPQRVATGFDYRRLSILLAVLEKRANLRLSIQNVFLNIAGGIRIDEPAVDLAICCAIASNFSDKFARNDTVVIGEVGLGGEVRSVNHIEKRIQEAAKLGFKRVILPTNNIKAIKSKADIEIVGVDNLGNALNKIF